MKKKDIIDSDELFDIEYEFSDEQDDETSDESDTSDDIVLSKHKMQGKHSLKYDTIFKGRKDTGVTEEDDLFSEMSYHNDSFEIDRSTVLYEEYRDTEQYLREKKVKEKVYQVLATKTELNFMNNRRKPSRSDFNNYYHLIVNELREERFSNVEIFNELAVYFSDNLFNMFKLLDNKWRTDIINELQEHIGKNQKKTEITNRNLINGTEVEFVHIDMMGDEKMITGVICECDYENEMFKVNSYENIYNVSKHNIMKILKNDFKFNLNKLNNIDFL